MLETIRRYVDWLSDAYAPSRAPLGIIRIAFGVVIILTPAGYTWVAGLPLELFAPVAGLPSVFTAPPPLGFLIALEVARAAVAVWLVVGWRTVAASITLSVILMLGSSIVYSFSKVDHFVLFELAPIALAAAGWGNALSWDSHRRQAGTRGFAVLVWAMTVGFALLTAAIPKAISGWLNPSTQGALAYVEEDVAFGVKTGPLAAFLVGLHVEPLWKLLDIATVFAEGWLVVAFLAPGLFRLGLLLISVFHVGVFLTLGIDFSPYVFVYAVFLCVPLRRWFPEATLLRSRLALRSRGGPG